MQKPNNLLFIFLILILFSCEKEEITETIEDVNLPQIETFEVTDINIFSIKMGCRIIDQGDSEISEIGLVIDTISQPQLDKNFNKFNFPINETGAYETTVTGLPEEVTTYYIRAYAINEQGIGYGNEVQFSTLGNKTFHGPVNLSSQEEVIEFGAKKYNTINGHLKIEGTVEDLSPLEDLYNVNADFIVENTTKLKNFNGLKNLRRTGVNFPNGFYVRNNKALINFEGLKNLDVTRGDFYVLYNPKLENLEGLDNFFAASAGSLRIENNDNLVNLKGLEKLEFIGLDFALVNNSQLNNISSLSKLNFVSGAVIFAENNSLTNLNGLASLKDINYLLVRSNPLLTDLSAVENCESLNSLKIAANKNLTSLPYFQKIRRIDNIELNGSKVQNFTGLENLEEIGNITLFQSDIESLEGISSINEINTLEVYECQNLKNLHGLEEVLKIDNLAIRNCYNFDNLQGFKLSSISSLALVETKISSLQGLESLKKITKEFTLNNNQSLESTSGLENIEEIYNLWIDGNSSLKNIENFKNLKSLNYLFVLYNESLKNLDGFNNLETINELGILNSHIESLSGLDNLKEIKDSFKATHNFNLENFCSLSDAFQNFTGTYEVYTNAINPTLEDLKNGNCD